MKTTDYYVETFQKFLAQGMSHLEALNQFDRKEWNEAMMREPELKRGSIRMLELCGLALREEMDLEDLDQAMELWGAGWTSETPYKAQQIHIMSWYWRRPSKRKGSKGRLFLSTNQAYNAYKKEMK